MEGLAGSGSLKTARQKKSYQKMTPIPGDILLLSNDFPRPFLPLSIRAEKTSEGGYMCKVFVSGPHRLYPGDQFLVLETNVEYGVSGYETKQFLFMNVLTNGGMVGWVCFSHVVEPYLHKRTP